MLEESKIVNINFMQNIIYLSILTEFKNGAFKEFNRGTFQRVEKKYREKLLIERKSKKN